MTKAMGGSHCDRRSPEAKHVPSGHRSRTAKGHGALVRHRVVGLRNVGSGKIARCDTRGGTGRVSCRWDNVAVKSTDNWHMAPA